ncbi:MAG: biopolymer transporter ExbD [Burkholderiales bacterium]|nr:MAG: biopolymer transporter ExbD [Burkholderiales bacterium]
MRFRRPLDEEPELNLVPLIDVMLIVLIFLAVTTTYSRYSELRLQLPGAQASPVDTRVNEIVVGVSADGRFAFDQTVLADTEPEAVAQVLTRASQGLAEPMVVIHADAQAPHQAVVNVMEAARRANLSRISFITERTTPAAR